MTIIDEKYLSEISKFTSGYAFRGQANSNWQLHSGATRRLIKHYHENIIQAPDFPRIYANYHSDVLIKPAQTNGFDIDDSYQISDLQLLAKLQHFEAAMGLLDFTWNPLVALWFACKDNEDCDGKVFGINLRDPLRFQQVPNEAEKQSIEAIFLPGDNADKLLYWEPKLHGEAAPRILRQRSVFVIGRPLIPEDVLQDVEIRASDKALIKKELEDIFDISERTLFMDMAGFSVVNKAESPVHQIDDPAYYFFLANQFYQQGDYSQAVVNYNKCIDLEPQISETYFLRGNAKAEMKNYPDAKQDYDLAIHYKDNPFSNRDPNTNILFNWILWMVYFNRGNVRTELSDYEGALEDYNEAFQQNPLDQRQRSIIFFNRANTNTVLHRFEDAIEDYNDAIRLGATPNARFNKGNTLIILGRFDEARQCYDEVIRAENDRTDAVNNHDKVAEILNLIDDMEYEIHLTQIEDNNTELVDVQIPSDNLPERIFGFQGNIGNTGNFGYNLPGGTGFDGKMHFAVRVRGSQG